MSIIVGTSGSDNLTGTSGSDVVIAGSGNDTINSGTGNDIIIAGAGNDTIDAGAGNDIINAGAGNDYIDGGAGRDIILAGSGNDTVVFDANDILENGGSGFDTLLVLGANQTVNILDDEHYGCNWNYGVTITGFELIDLNGSGANTLNINGDGLEDETEGKNLMTGLKNSLVVKLGSDDVVNMIGKWTDRGGTTLSDGNYYHIYESSKSFLFVENRGPVVTHVNPVSFGEDDSPMTTAMSSILTISDPDPHDTASITNVVFKSSDMPAVISSVLASFSGGNLMINPGQFNALAAGDQLHLTFQATLSDGHPGGITTQDFVITINGVNDAALIAGQDTGSVTEDANVNADGNLVASGVLTVSDVDHGQNSFKAGTYDGTYGSLTLDAAGNWTYAALDSQNAIQSLAQDEQMTDTITIKSFDGTTHDIVITFTGVNDAASISGDDTGSVTEDANVDANGNLVASGVLTVSDVDHGQNSFQAGSYQGAYGNVALDAQGNWSYSANDQQGAIQALAQGEQMTDTITVKSFDGTTHDIVITFTGVNDAALIAGQDTGSVTEDTNVNADGNLVASGVLTVSDVDHGQNSFQAGSYQGAYGNVALDAQGNWSYSANDQQGAIQALAQGEQMTDTITVKSFDGTTHDIVITFTGVNDAALIAGQDTGSVTEDANVNADGNLVASGVLTVSDPDHGENVFQTPASLAGTYGTFTFNATSGEWAYAVDDSRADIQALNDGQSLTDTLTVTSKDGTASQNIVVTINGVTDNHPPVLTVSATTGDVDENAAGGVIIASQAVNGSDGQLGNSGNSNSDTSTGAVIGTNTGASTSTTSSGGSGADASTGAVTGTNTGGSTSTSTTSSGSSGVDASTGAVTSTNTDASTSTSTTRHC